MQIAQYEEVTDAHGNLSFALRLAEEGFYRVEVELLDGRGRVVDSERQLFEIRADRTEIADPAVRADLLYAIASATGGRVLTPKQAPDAPIPDREIFRLEERRRLELWDNSIVYLGLLLALTGEWWLRRRVGLA